MLLNKENTPSEQILIISYFIQKYSIVYCRAV